MFVDGVIANCDNCLEVILWAPTFAVLAIFPMAFVHGSLSSFCSGRVGIEVRKVVTRLLNI